MKRGCGVSAFEVLSAVDRMGDVGKMGMDRKRWNGDRKGRCAVVCCFFLSVGLRDDNDDGMGYKKLLCCVVKVSSKHTQEISRLFTAHELQAV